MMTKEERKLTIEYLEGIKDKYVEGYGYESHPLPEYYAIESAIKELKQESILDRIKAEIEALNPMDYQGMFTVPYRAASNMQEDILKILDKYRNEVTV